MRHFFRVHDFGEEVADLLFDHLDPEGNEEIDHRRFVKVMSPFFNDYRPGSPSLLMPHPVSKSRQDSLMAIEEEARKASKTPRVRTSTKDVVKEFTEVLDMIGKKAAFKFKTLHEAWRYVDNNKNGAVCLGEMRAFFRAFNLSQESADAFFNRIEHDQHGEIPYAVFVKYFAPYVQPDFSGGYTHMPN